MDINYLLEREQVSLHNAEIAASSTARLAHSGLAAGYGDLLAEKGFPHRAKSEAEAVRKEPGVLDWENEGGSAGQTGSEVSASTANRSPASDNTPEASRGHVVKTPEAVSSVRAGEQLIHEKTPTPPPRDTAYDFPPVPAG
jgi:hypothetical protein